VSSGAHATVGKVNLYNRRNSYPSTKLANVLFARELDRRLKKSGDKAIKVVSLHPGLVPTEFIQHVLNPDLLRLTEPISQHIWKVVPQCAETSVYCAFHPDVVPGGYYSAVVQLSPLTRENI
jgi:NAD(P)-dependent dehydrogenase (short-subunit alcohol dehydrogenase family)